MLYLMSSILKLLAFHLIIFAPANEAIECYVCSSYSSNHCLSPSLKVGLPTEECSQNVKTCSTEITTIDSDICPIHNAKCFNHSRFREEVVIRGCSANDFEYPENNSGEEQQIYVATNCSTSLCNNENFVQDNCIQCRGSKLNGNCYSDFSKEMMITCPNIVKTPKGCFTAFNATTGEVRRDCASILNEEVITYKICFGDFCNSQILNISDENVNKIEENVELSENDSNKSDKNSNEFTANVNNSEKNVNKSVECVDKIQDNLNESEESLNISTGEDSNRPESVQNSFPNSEETSIDKNNTQWCLQCRSEIDGECSLLESSEKFEKKCEKTNIPGEKSGCFTSKMGKIVQRGCQNQLDSSQFDKCRHGKWCTLCCENNCNNEKIVESKSGRLIVNYMVFLSLFLSIIPFRLE